MLLSCEIVDLFPGIDMIFSAIFFLSGKLTRHLRTFHTNISHDVARKKLYLKTVSLHL